MDNQLKVEDTKAKTKNEEIADLIEQQVQSVIDPFAATFSALWGNSSLLSELKNVQKQTGTNLDTHENVHNENFLGEDSYDHVQEETLNKLEHVQKQAVTNLDDVNTLDEDHFNKEQYNDIQKSSLSKLEHVQKQTSINLDSISQEILNIVRTSANFTLIGFITFLNVLYPEGKGEYSVNGLARISKMSRTSIRGNLQNLEKLHFITLTENKIFLSSQCMNWINLYRGESEQNRTCTYSDMIKKRQGQIETCEEATVKPTVLLAECTNLDMDKIGHASPFSSSCCNTITTTTARIGNKNMVENIHGQKSTLSDFVHTQEQDAVNLNQSENRPLWLEKTLLKNRAEELFYIALAAETHVEEFSMQTLNLYNHLSQEKGRDYAAALFFQLLPKAKDNPTGYVSSAYKQGAEPTSASIVKIKEIWEALDSLAKAPDLQKIKLQIQEAVIKDDTDTLVVLTQIQSKIKSALRLFSWLGTLEALVEKRDVFLKELKM